MGSSSVMQQCTNSKEPQETEVRVSIKEEPSFILATCVSQLEFIEGSLEHREFDISTNGRYGLAVTLADIRGKLDALACRIPDGVIR